MNERIRHPRVSEKAEQAHIVQLLRRIGGQVYVIGTRRRSGDYQGTMQTPGIPDLLVFLPRRSRGRCSISGTDREDCTCDRCGADRSVPHVLLFIECKAAGGRLRDEQQQFQQFCRWSHVEHVVGNLDAVIAWLSREGYVRTDQFPTYRQPKENRA